MHDHFEGFLNRKRAKKSEGTYKCYQTGIRDFQQWLDDNGHDPMDIDHQEIEAYMLDLADEGYAPKTVQNRYVTVQQFYNYLVDWIEAIDDDNHPFEKLDRSDYVNGGSRKRDAEGIIYATLEEKEAMCDNPGSPSLRNELMIRLMWQLGIRKGELRAIQLSDIAGYDPDAGDLSIESEKDRGIAVETLKRENHTRTVYFQPSLDFYLLTWVNSDRQALAGAADSSYLLPTHQSEQIGPKATSRVVADSAENAGIQEVVYVDKAGIERRRITPHALRHGHAVHALKCGIDLRTIQKNLGHANLETTSVYLELIDSDIRELYSRRFNPIEEPEFE